MADLKVGKITHFFDKIMVAVLLVEEETVKVGDTIKIVGHGQEFQQVIASMQVEHDQVDTAEKGMEVGMKVDQTVKEGDTVFKVIE